jgi:tetratricopeptide (TPR) repeat protein
MGNVGVHGLWDISRADGSYINRPWGRLEYEIFNIGLEYGKKDKFDEAVDAFSRVILINPRNALAYFSRGIYYFLQGKFSQAISDYNKAIEINPDFAPAYSARGFAYQEKGNLLQAISDYNKAIEIDPGLVEVYNKRAVVYFLKKEYDKSWQDVYKANVLGYKISPEFLDALKIISEGTR